MLENVSAPSMFTDAVVTSADGAAMLGKAPDDADAGPPAPTGFHVMQHSFDFKAALSAKVPGVGSGDASGKTAVLVYELMLDSRENAVAQPNGDLFIQRFSAGLSMTVILREIKANIALNFVSASIASRVQLANSVMRIRTFGLGPVALPQVPEFALNQEGGLAQALTYIIAVRDHIRDHPNQLMLEPETVVVGRRAENLDAEIGAIVFALRQIEKDRRLSAALREGANAGVDPDIIVSVYRNFLRNLTDDPDPTDQQRREARQWLSV
jgi:hypothetical protein